MTHCLRKFLWDFVLCCYLDDILIYSNANDKHLEQIIRVLEVLQEMKLYVKGSKCEFIRPSVGRGSMDKESSKVEEVKNWPIPKTMPDKQAFLVGRVLQEVCS
jgi:hypothetical protein